MNRFALAIAVISAKAIMIGACSSGPSSSDADLAPSAIIEENKRILIVDETGKEWDVTHAKEKYSMEPSKFQFGLGPNAIRPILNPEFLSPGDANYPGDHDDFLVLGTSLNGETRAYAIDKLIDHEIADEQFGDLHVAVAYWPLVDLAAVYSREIADISTSGDHDGILTLSASGWTYDFTFVLYDYETESLWYHLEGEDGLTCISGVHADRKLREFPSTKTRWRNWKIDHPNTKFLDPKSQ